MRRSARAAVTQFVGYAEKDHKDKQLCRDTLVAVAKAKGIVVSNCFTLAGMYDFCASLFHKNWPNAKIVSIERQKNIARYSKANAFCTVLNTSFSKYTKGIDPFVLSGETFVPKSNFTYPKFDLVFLDFCANPRDYDMIRDFVVNHTAPNAVFGVTFSIHPKLSVDNQLDRVADDLRTAISVVVPVKVEEKIPYTTGSKMIFVVFSKSES